MDRQEILDFFKKTFLISQKISWDNAKIIIFGIVKCLTDAGCTSEGFRIVICLHLPTLAFHFHLRLSPPWNASSCLTTPSG